MELLVSTEAETLDPRYTLDSVGMRATRLLHAGLVRLDEKTLEPLPYLAESWSWEGDFTLHVALRKNLRFHSGAPFEAEDVVKTLAAFGAPSVGSRHAHVVEAIDYATADNPHAVTIRLKRKRATLLTDLELPILRRDEALSPPHPGGHLDGLGPFELTGSTRGIIEMKPAVTGVGPLAEHPIVIRTVRDENARALRFIGERADVAVNSFSPALLLAMNDQANLASASVPGANLTYMVFETSRGPLADVHLRRALAYGVPREMIAATLLGGNAHVAHSLIPENHWAYTKQPITFTHDPEKARNEVSLASPGVRPHLSLLTSTDRVRRTIARTIAQELEAAGIDVTVTPLELGALLGRLSAGDFELATLQIPEFTEPNLLKIFLHSEYAPPHGSNRGRVHDRELDALLDEGDTTRDPAQRREIYSRVEVRVRDNVYLLPLWHEDQVVVTSARARAFAPSTEGRWLGIARLK